MVRYDNKAIVRRYYDEVLNQRVWIGCFPWKFNGGEAAFCRLVAFVGK